jgi:hypothetical protein
MGVVVDGTGAADTSVAIAESTAGVEETAVVETVVAGRVAAGVALGWGEVGVGETAAVVVETVVAGEVVTVAQPKQLLNHSTKEEKMA